MRRDTPRTNHPRHKVQLLTPFAVGRFAVTFEEWDACVADHGCRKYMPPDRGWGRGRQPVIAIWWDDAIAYVRWVSQKTGRNYRLLSEAEREYVARAGTTTPFWWGNSIFSNRANYASSRGGEVQRKPLPVDSFEPNPWGLYQVHGNVSEWIGDCWHYDYEGAPLDGTAWTSIDCERPMLRGGNWNSTMGAALRVAWEVGLRCTFFTCYRNAARTAASMSVLQCACSERSCAELTHRPCYHEPLGGGNLMPVGQTNRRGRPPREC